MGDTTKRTRVSLERDLRRSFHFLFSSLSRPAIFFSPFRRASKLRFRIYRREAALSRRTACLVRDLAFVPIRRGGRRDLLTSYA